MPGNITGGATMTKFGISLSGMGQQPVGTDMRQSFLEILEYVRTARDLGFDFAYQGQHYLTSPYQQLQTMPLLARLAAEAEGMSLVATLLIPLHHPVDLAERIATMDVITDGRFILSAALGYRDEEYEAFGVQRKQRVSRYLECLEVMKLLWTQDEVSFQGKHFQLKNARMVLKPVQKPHSPIWVAANSDAAIKRAARRGYTWYVNPHATYTTIARQIGLYRQTASEAGSPVPAELPIGRELFVHEDRNRAFEEVRPFLGGKYEAYSQWGQDRALPGEESFSTSFQELARDRFIIGDPEDCITELEKYRALGMAYGSFRMMWPGMDLRKGIRNMELFAEKVMPHFK
jgi:alkanesulfonate monooxygenase SsuD/methylene tetrahydromethanopterin reductase-like flavin-dependent oxidoreductase (luciferase family)